MFFSYKIFVWKILSTLQYICCFTAHVVIRTSGFVRKVRTKGSYVFADKTLQTAFVRTLLTKADVKAAMHDGLHYIIYQADENIGAKTYKI